MQIYLLLYLLDRSRASHNFDTILKMRRFMADTTAMISFSFVVGMFIEIVISGLTFGQSLQSRITGIVVNLLTGGLYGKFRDWIFINQKLLTINQH